MTRTPGSRPKVVFAMITVGDGHKVPAIAGASWLEAAAPNELDIEVLDFTRAVGDDALDRRHKASWAFMLRHPWTAYYGQRLIDRAVPTRLARGVQARMLNRHADHVASWLRDERPDLVVATHFFTVQALALARRRGAPEVPFVSLVVDAMDAHVLWAEPRADAHLVYSEASKRDLTRRGVPEDRVHRIDPVLRPEFGATCDPGERDAARAALGVPEDAFVAFWSGGGEGAVGPVLATLERLERRSAATRRPIALIVLCGRNDAVRERLARAWPDRPDRHVRVVPLGYRDDVRSIVCAADVAVGKAGPSSTFEALACGRPFLFTGYAAANERALIDGVVAAGAGAFVPVPARVADTLARWAHDPAATASLRAGVARMAVRNGGPEFARFLLDRFLAPA